MSKINQVHVVPSSPNVSEMYLVIGDHNVGSWTHLSTKPERTLDMKWRRA